MPTNLPDDFTGTGKPDDEPVEIKLESEKLTPVELAAVLLFGFPVVAAFVFALVGAMVYLGMWCFTHLPTP